jgi:hypothetical protein
MPAPNCPCHPYLCQLSLAEVKDLLTQQLQDVHAVLTQCLIRFAGRHKVWDEALPLLGPVLQGPSSKEATQVQCWQQQL